MRTGVDLTQIWLEAAQYSVRAPRAIYSDMSPEVEQYLLGEVVEQGRTLVE